MQIELNTRFQEQNELLERMMRRLEALDNQAPASPEPAEVTVAKDEAPAPGEPALGAQHIVYSQWNQKIVRSFRWKLT